MPIPDYQSLMRPLLAHLADGGIHPLSELLKDLIAELNLTPDEVKEKLPSGRQTIINNRVGWAKTYLAKAGLLNAPKRAHYEITVRGLKALEECPEKIDNDYLRKYEEFKQFISVPNAIEEEAHLESKPKESETTPDEQIAAAHQALNSSLVDEILRAI